jgi:hypothetical protein
MNESTINTMATGPISNASRGLFLWRGGGIILIGEREGGSWILARAWLAGDCLEHVRRWSFAQPIPFSGQVRRLVMEANADFAHARDEGRRALTWAESTL